MAEATRVVTFLFSDIEGSVRLWEKAPDKMQSALAQHDALSRDCVAAQGGRVVKTTGDGIHAVFDHPGQALQAVLQLQLALAAGEAPLGLALQVRCGLHLGTDNHRDGDFYGPAVNRAARIMGAAHGGQTLLSEALAERLAESALPAHTSLRDLGRVRLRDLAEPVRLFQLVHPQLRNEFPPLRSLEGTPNNLPQQLNSFIGREEELQQVRELLSKHRLLMLLGMGGIGKSRLSVQLGAEVLDEHADGVWLVELAPLTDARLLPQVVAAVLGVKEETTHSVVDSLLNYVRDKQLLFIFDNCEHLLSSCAALTKQLLQAGAGVKVLATSRAVLQIAGEVTCQVPTLGIPQPREGQLPLSAEALMAYDAVRLFDDRARAVQADFQVTAKNAAAVADICHRLDGIPLALELAAARTRTLSVNAIAQRLGDRFRLLTTADQTVLPRQRTLRALIDWSHDLLPLAERMLFRRLAVFAGGWTLDAAEHVGADDGLDGFGVVEALARLVEQSLVVMEFGGERYRMLDTVRHYAQEQLEAAQETAATGLRHLTFYLDFAERARPALASPDQGTWLAQLDAERENFSAAHACSARAPSGDLLGLRLMHALRPYWIRRGSLSIGWRIAHATLARDGLRARDENRCMALFGAGQISFFMGRHAAAATHLGECLAIARETGNSAVLARVLQPLGLTSVARHDYAQANTYLQEALALAQVQGDPRELAAAWSALAMLHRLQGRLDAAESACQKSLALARALGDLESVGIGLVTLAMVAVDQQSPQPATQTLAQAIELAQQTGSQRLLQSATDACAGLAALVHDWQQAAVFFGTAQAQLEEASGSSRDPADQAFVTAHMAAAHQALGGPRFLALEARGRGSEYGRGLADMRQWLTQTLPRQRVSKRVTS